MPTEIAVTDRHGTHYPVLYFVGESLDSFSGKRQVNLRSSLVRLSLDLFPQYTLRMRCDFFEKFFGDNQFDLVLSDTGDIIAFHVYKVGFITIHDRSAKVIYVDHAGTHSEFQNRGLSLFTRMSVFEQEEPDIICGSSANPAIYALNVRLAAQMQFQLFPTMGMIPEYVVRIARDVDHLFHLHEKATLHDNLTRTYPGSVSHGTGSHPLSDFLHLGANDHIFYILVSPKIISLAANG